MTQGWEEAERHFDVAVATNARMGARPWLAHTECDYARMLHARDGLRDRERARALLDTARKTYCELGMENYAVAAAARAQEAGSTT